MCVVCVLCVCLCVVYLNAHLILTQFFFFHYWKIVIYEYHEFKILYYDIWHDIIISFNKLHYNKEKYSYNIYIYIFERVWISYDI